LDNKRLGTNFVKKNSSNKRIRLENVKKFRTKVLSTTFKKIYKKEKEKN